MKKICPLCGTENEEDSRFCKECNEPLYNPNTTNISKEPNRKRQIEEEEKIRAEARVKAEDEVKKKKEKEEQKNKGIGCLVFIGLVVIFYFVLFGGGGDKEEETKPSYVSLHASVNFTGTQFIIANNDNFDWIDVKMEVNGSFLKSGFILKTNRMEAGNTYNVGALQFAKNDGTRFNPVAYKPKSFTISCKTPNGEDAFWSGGWD